MSLTTAGRSESVRAPGKLFIAGEYAVVTPGQPAMLVGVNRGVSARAVARGSGDPASVTPPSAHVRAVTALIQRLRRERGDTATADEPTPELVIDSDLDDASGRKFGLGSSAAVTVAALDTLARWYGLRLDRAMLVRLAIIATVAVSPAASGGDVAAAALGGWVSYRSPDRQLLARRMRSGAAVDEVAADPEIWSHFEASAMPAPHSLSLLVGWTGSPASTDDLVARASHAVDPGFLAASATVVTRLSAALEHHELPAALDAMRTARELLRALGERAQVEIETPGLRTLCDIAESYGAAAKPAGAGGGDCGIALAGDDVDARALTRAWAAHGIRPLELQVSERVHDEGMPR